MASDNETEICKQVVSPGVNGNPEDASKGDARAGSSKFGFGFSSTRWEKVDRRRAAYDLRMQMKDLQFRLRELGTTGGSDSDESIFAEALGVRQRETRSLLSSQRNSLGKTSTDWSYVWSITNRWQRRTAGRISKLSRHYQLG